MPSVYRARQDNNWFLFACILVGLSALLNLFNRGSYLYFMGVITLIFSVAGAVLLFLAWKEKVPLFVPFAVFLVMALFNSDRVLGIFQILIFVFILISVLDVIKIQLPFSLPSKASGACLISAALLVFLFLCTMLFFLFRGFRAGFMMLTFRNFIYYLAFYGGLALALFATEPQVSTGFTQQKTQGQQASASSTNYTPQNGTEPEGYCGLIKHVLLLLFTFSIWYFIWIYRTTKYLNRTPNMEQRDPVAQLLLCMFVPFYSIYWFYKTAQRLDALSQSKNIPSDLSTICLILAIFVAIVAAILIQDKINSLAQLEAYGPTGGSTQSTYTQNQTSYTQQQSYTQPTPPPTPPQPIPQASQAPIDAADEIRKYKELLEMGAITQEEFDQKKKQLLNLS